MDVTNLATALEAISLPALGKARTYTGCWSSLRDGYKSVARDPAVMSTAVLNLGCVDTTEQNSHKTFDTAKVAFTRACNNSRRAMNMSARFESGCA